MEEGKWDGSLLYFGLHVQYTTTHHENMATTYDMMMNLKEIFREQNRAGRQVAMKALLNTKMAEGTPV